MPIGSILQQPGSASTPVIVSAYRPIIFRVSATRTDGQRQPPVVYCDVYFDDFFYRSVPSTQCAKVNGSDTEWKFDISDLAQEYLRRDMPVNGGQQIINAVRQVAKVLVKFRSSGFDGDRFLVPEGVAPVQGTATRTSISGTGTPAETFMVLAAALQHRDNQDLLQHLTYSIHNGTFGANCYPLSHRPSPVYLCKDDSDYFPFIYLGSKALGNIDINYKLRATGTTPQTPGADSGGTPGSCSSTVSGVQAVVLDSLDVQISYGYSGTANQWEWNINGGTWNTVPSNPFTIPLNELLTYLITEAGEPIITDDNGNIIVPENVDVFDIAHTVNIRPRCSNNQTGTAGSATFTVQQSSVPGTTQCDPPVSFSFDHIEWLLLGGAKIWFNLELPAGATEFQLEWRFDYGGGFISNPVTQLLTFTTSPFAWFTPSSITANGTFLVKIRTKCADGSFSQQSNEVSVAYNRPAVQVPLAVTNVQVSTATFTAKVTVMLSAAVADALNVQGWVQFNTNGTLTSVLFGGSIPAGVTSAIFTVPVQAGAIYTGVKSITSVTPNPTSDGKTIVYV